MKKNLEVKVIGHFSEDINVYIAFRIFAYFLTFINYIILNVVRV